MKRIYLNLFKRKVFIIYLLKGILKAYKPFDNRDTLEYHFNLDSEYLHKKILYFFSEYCLILMS